MKSLFIGALFVFAFVTAAYSDCTVGGVTLELKPKNMWADTDYSYFNNAGRHLLNDKNKITYTFDFHDPNRYEIFKNVIVESDFKFDKQYVKQCNNEARQAILPVIDLNPIPIPQWDLNSADPEGTIYDCMQGIKTKKEHTIKYLLNGDKLAEFTGILELKIDSDEVWLVPYKGVYNLACGEVQTLRVNDPFSVNTVLIKMSAEGVAKKDAIVNKNRKASREADAAAEKKIKAFRKNVKLGSNVRIMTNNLQAQGTITKIKGDMVEVQYTMQVLRSKWKRIIPYKEWVGRDKLLYPETNSWVLSN